MGLGAFRCVGLLVWMCLGSQGLGALVFRGSCQGETKVVWG